MQETCNFDTLYAYLSTSNYDFNYDRAKNLRPKRNIKTAMNHGATALQLVTHGLGEPRTPGLLLATTAMAGKRYKPVNPTGFNCVNVLVQRAISKVLSRERDRARAAAHYEANKQDALKKRKARYAENKGKEKAQMATNHQKNRSDRLVAMKTYREKPENRNARNANEKKRRRTDPVFQLTERCRSALSRFLKRNEVDKAGGTAELLGCDFKAFTEHMNAQLDGRDKNTPEMDHIFPFFAFKKEVTTAQSKVMHHSNLQPLTVKENAFKRDKFPTKAMAAKVNPACWPDGITMDMLPDIYPGWTTPLRM